MFLDDMHRAGICLVSSVFEVGLQFEERHGEAVNYSSRDRQGVVIRSDLRPLTDGRGQDFTSSELFNLAAGALPLTPGFSRHRSDVQ